MSSYEEQHLFKCLQCGGALTPEHPQCQYCGYYNGVYHAAKANPEVYTQPESEPEEDDDDSYQSTPATQGGVLRQVLHFSIVLLTVSIIGSVFTNSTIQADFTAIAIPAETAWTDSISSIRTRISTRMYT